MQTLLTRLLDSTARLLPWLAMVALLLACPAMLGGQQAAEVVGKAYALLATVVAAVPFFRQERSKEDREIASSAKGETPEDQARGERATALIEAQLTAFQPGDVRLMRLALGLALAAFAIDFYVTVNKP